MVEATPVIPMVEEDKAIKGKSTKKHIDALTEELGIVFEEGLGPKDKVSLLEEQGGVEKVPRSVKA